MVVRRIGGRGSTGLCHSQQASQLPASLAARQGRQGRAGRERGRGVSAVIEKSSGPVPQVIEVQGGNKASGRGRRGAKREGKGRLTQTLPRGVA